MPYCSWKVTASIKWLDSIAFKVTIVLLLHILMPCAHDKFAHFKPKIGFVVAALFFGRVSQNSQGSLQGFSSFAFISFEKPFEKDFLFLHEESCGRLMDIKQIGNCYLPCLNMQSN
jgi:hypothetical protein